MWCLRTACACTTRAPPWPASWTQGSLLELRTGFGVGIHTALARIEGRPVGLLANNPQHLGGAIDADAADKAARFMQLCNAHGLPLVSLVDTPGFMVGPDTEARPRCAMSAACLSPPPPARAGFSAWCCARAMAWAPWAMAGGGFHAPVFTVAWPTGEFGAMGLEGAVRLMPGPAAPTVIDPDGLLEFRSSTPTARSTTCPSASRA
jgi:acetyl-CoA carboxylase carboxyltransferase component